MISARIKRDFRERLTVPMVVRRSFVGLFNQDASLRAWIDDFQERCARDLRESLEEVSQEGHSTLLMAFASSSTGASKT